jgi:quercetin dioxygenase-like cupin family protein
MSIAQSQSATTLRGGAPVVFSPKPTDWIETLPGEKILFRVRSGEVGGRYAVLETVAAPGSASPAHYHAEDEVFQVLSGTMTFMLDGEIVSAPAGTTVVIPAGVPHCWKNRSDGEVRMLATFTPGGVEALFERLGTLTPDQIGPVAASFGTIIVGPPID